MKGISAQRFRKLAKEKLQEELKKEEYDDIYVGQTLSMAATEWVLAVWASLGCFPASIAALRAATVLDCPDNL